MARDYGRVKTKFWDNEDIKGCSPAAKMMALYLLTSQHSNAIGLYRLPVAYMQDDTGLTKDEIIQAFSELRAIGFVAWCERMPWIWIRHYLKHNKPENPNVWRKCVKELQSVPGECLESVESVAADLSQIAREPRMMREHGGISADEITVLKQYRNRIETVVPDKNNHGAGLMPLSLPEPEPIPEPEPSSGAPPSAAPPHPPPDMPKPKATERKATRWDHDGKVPPNWLLDGERIRDEHGLPRVDLRLEARKFENYWPSKPGRGATHVDWKKTWLNWCLSAKGDAHAQRISAHDKGTLGAAIWLAREEGSGDGTGEAGDPLPQSRHGPAQVGVPVRRLLGGLSPPDDRDVPGGVQILPPEQRE